MRARTLAVLTGLLALAACRDVNGPDEMTPVDDAAFVAAISPSIGELGQYLAPALTAYRTRLGSSATRAECEAMEQLQTRLREREQVQDSAGAAEFRLQLRVRAAQMIHAGLGGQVLQEMEQRNERAQEQLREQIRLRLVAGGDTAAYQHLLREMEQQRLQLQQHQQQGRSGEALELAARLRERWRLHEGEHLAGTDAAFVAAVEGEVGALGGYLAPALAQVRAARGDAAGDAMRQEMAQFREELQVRVQAGGGAAADTARLRLRLAAAYAIHAGSGEGPCNELLAGNEQLMNQLRQQIAERQQQQQDVTGAQRMLQEMTELQEQARLALAAGRNEAGLEFAARVRERWHAGE